MSMLILKAMHKIAYEANKSSKPQSAQSPCPKAFFDAATEATKFIRRQIVQKAENLIQGPFQGPYKHSHTNAPACRS